MGIYGHTWDKYRIENSTIELSESEMKDALLEMYMDLFEEAYSEDEEVLEEGTNLDIRAIWKDSQKEMKSIRKEYKAAMKAKDYKKASVELGKLESMLKSNKTKMEKVPADSWESSVLGFFAWTLMTTIELIIPIGIQEVGSMGAYAAGLRGVCDGSRKAAVKAVKDIGVASRVIKIGQVGEIIGSIVILYKDLKKTFEESKKADLSDAAKSNLYRTKLLRYMDDYIKKVDKLKSELAKAKEKEESK
jgi:hypothetical protein